MPVTVRFRRIHEMKTLAALLTSCLLVPVSPVAAQSNSDEVLLFTYFRNNGQDGVHLATSTNGVNFVALNDDKAIFTPPHGRDRT